MTQDFSDERVIRSWGANASQWTEAVRDRKIESRNLVTDDAIVAAVTGLAPRTVLDLGCGEGWLARRLAGAGAIVTGVDVIPELIERATQSGGGKFVVASYESIAAGALTIEADVIVANFSLIGKEAVEGVIDAVPAMLADGGHFVVQTLHPHMATGDGPYADGWREGSWTGFGPEFTDPAPWYFRTLESWISLLASGGLEVRELREPIDPRTSRPASLILIARRKSPR